MASAACKNISTEPRILSTSMRPGVFMTWSMKYITRKSNTMMIGREIATACINPGTCGASIMRINMAATPACGTMIGTATGESGELDRGRCAGDGPWRLRSLEDDLQRGDQQDQSSRDPHRVNGDTIPVQENPPGQDHKRTEH